MSTSVAAAGSALPAFRARLRRKTLSRRELLVSNAKPGRGRVYDSITDTIGDTPLVRLDRIAGMKDVRAHLLAKLEFFNPIGSVKDRIGVARSEEHTSKL